MASRRPRKSAKTAAPVEAQFFNRHFSWLQFNERVLEEARDAANPLLERVKFLAITASNLDEFVEVRVAGMMQQVENGAPEPGPDGRSPADVLPELTARIHKFVTEQYACWRDELVPALAAESIRLPGVRDLLDDARDYVEKFYAKTVDPLLTPVTIDPAHPFPHVLNKALCIAFLIKRKRRGGQTYLGVVTVPRALPRLVRVPSKEGTVEYVFLHEIVRAFADRLYHGYTILSSASRATATCISKRKNRAASSKPWTCRFTAAARATPSAWRSKPTPTRKSLIVSSPTSASRPKKSFASTVRSTFRAFSISTTKPRARI
jgi:polyphosphate kinase